MVVCPEYTVSVNTVIEEIVVPEICTFRSNEYTPGVVGVPESNPAGVKPNPGGNCEPPLAKVQVRGATLEVPAKSSE